MTIALFEALNEIKDTLPGPLSITAWPGGECNRLFHIQSPLQQTALRLNHPDLPSLGVDRRREINILLNLSNEAWSPKLIAACPRWLLCQWAPGEAAPSGDAADLDVLALALQQVHHHRPQGEPLNVADQIQTLLKYAKPLPAHIHAFLRDQCHGYDFVRQPVLCHHDWHPGNLMLNGSEWTLLDWEFAAAGDPAMDVAGVCLGFNLSEAQALRLADQMSIGPDRLRQAQCLMSALAMVWYRANPGLATSATPGADAWYEQWCKPN
ncbi:phosphotransferase [Saccharospirillum sp.]|uniref:phosphotransferase n=1 Tax=Saccharospirillum sp. TaxID=2033801 RepID=UPI0034A04B13